MANITIKKVRRKDGYLVYRPVDQATGRTAKTGISIYRADKTSRNEVERLILKRLKDKGHKDKDIEFEATPT